MQKKSFLYKFKFCTYLLTLVMIILSSLLISCGSQDATPSTRDENCITISGKKIKRWLNDNWYTRGNKNSVPLLYFDPYEGPGGTLKNVDVFPTDNEKYVTYERRQGAAIQSSCKIPVGALVLPSYLKIEKYDFIDSASGNFKKIDFLRLTPQIDTSNKLFFKIDWIEKKDDKENIFLSKSSWPCPDYCCPGPRCPVQN